MSNPFLLKLASAISLTDQDRKIIDELVSRRRQVPAHVDLITAGERPNDVHLVLDGVACRYKMLPDGRRQIVAFLLPGDFCDLHVALLREMDHSIATVSPCTVVDISKEKIEDITLNHPRVTLALLWATLVDEAVLREWLVGMGQRSADRRMAHLFCELLTRMQAVGRGDDGGFEFPLTQSDLADTLGLSTVHVNRVLQQLRGDGLITLRDRRLVVIDPERLKAFAEFDPTYLHLVRREPQLPSARNPGKPSPAELISAKR